MKTQHQKSIEFSGIRVVVVVALVFLDSCLSSCKSHPVEDPAGSRSETMKTVDRFIIREKTIKRRTPSKIMFFIDRGIFIRGGSNGFSDPNQVRLSKKDAKSLIAWLQEAIDKKATKKQ